MSRQASVKTMEAQCIPQREMLDAAIKDYEAYFNTLPTIHRIVRTRFYPGAFNKPEDKDCGEEGGSALIISECADGLRWQYYLLFTQQNEDGTAIPAKLELNHSGDIGQFNHATREEHPIDMFGRRVTFGGGMSAHSRCFDSEGSLLGVHECITSNGDLITDTEDQGILAEAIDTLTAFNAACLAVPSELGDF